ncbi:ase-activated receptor 1 [Pelobates cultripes]|uniref:Ase-activated receptor 1 n=1 Tax=Pelobates cultripes TaxID=61616 RepID=A0AAD1SCB3_PELCU|nr:ase-activated receptor 1 [Pelobates cultripes]
MEEEFRWRLQQHLAQQDGPVSEECILDWRDVTQDYLDTLPSSVQPAPEGCQEEEVLTGRRSEAHAYALCRFVSVCFSDPEVCLEAVPCEALGGVARGGEPETTFYGNLMLSLCERIDRSTRKDCNDVTFDNQNETVDHLIANTGGKKLTLKKLYTVSKLGKFYLTSVWMITFIPSVYTVVFIVALPLNIMAIIIFLAKMKVRKPAVVYMLNLAVADVLFASTLPFKIVYHFNGNNWIFGSVMCRFVTATFYYNMYCSILLITAISVDRFLGVVFPIQSLSWRTVRRSWVVCILIWVISTEMIYDDLIIEDVNSNEDSDGLLSIGHFHT